MIIMVPVTGSITLPIPTHVIPTGPCEVGDHFTSHFTDEKTNTETLNNLCKVIRVALVHIKVKLSKSHLYSAIKP